MNFLMCFFNGSGYIILFSFSKAEVARCDSKKYMNAHRFQISQLNLFGYMREIVDGREMF